MTVAKFAVMRLFLVGVLGLIATVHIVRSAIASNYVNLDPSTAARAWPGHPRVAIAVAMNDIANSAAVGRGPSPITMAQLMSAARGAPLSVEPFLVLGAAELGRGRPKKAERLFREARERDPRSAAARYFLAQHYLQAGRVVEGLTEASALARLSPGGSTALIPALVQYARSPGAVPNLRKLFAANPALRDPVLNQLARDASNARLVTELAGDGFGSNAVTTPEWQTVLLKALVEGGNISQARSLWGRMSGLSSIPKGLFNPAFTKIAAPPPFNWALGNGNFGLAEPAPRGGLQVIYYGRDNAQFASQLLLLAPGSYEVRMRVERETASDEPTSLYWELVCRRGARELLKLALVRAKSSRSLLRGRFRVPVDCPSQQLVLKGVAREIARVEQLTISDLQLVAGER